MNKASGIISVQQSVTELSEFTETMSLMYIKKSTGLTIDPCGMPTLTCKGLEVFPLTFTLFLCLQTGLNPFQRSPSNTI